MPEIERTYGGLTAHFIEKHSTILSRDIEIEDIELIGGLFPRGKLSMIASAPGVGKSWGTLYFTYLFSKGGNLFDSEQNGKPYKSLVFCGEGGEEEPILRIKLTEWEIYDKNVILIDENKVHEDEISLLLTHEDGQRHLEGFIEYHKPDVVFIDSLLAFSDKDENASKDMDGLLKFLLRAGKKFNIALVLSHHTRKRKINERKAEQDMDEIIGTSYFARYIRQIIGLQPLRQEPGGDGNGIEPNAPIVVRNLKSYRKKFKPFTFQLVENERGKTEMVFDFMPDLGYGDPKYNLLNALRSIIGEEKEFTCKDAARIAKLGVSRAREILKDLVDRGELNRTGDYRNTRYILPKQESFFPFS